MDERTWSVVRDIINNGFDVCVHEIKRRRDHQIKENYRKKRQEERKQLLDHQQEIYKDMARTKQQNQVETQQPQHTTQTQQTTQTAHREQTGQTSQTGGMPLEIENKLKNKTDCSFCRNVLIPKLRDNWDRLTETQKTLVVEEYGELNNKIEEDAGKQEIKNHLEDTEVLLKLLV